jgi:hypothetical protein
LFGLVFIKKKGNQTKYLKKKKNRNRFKPNGFGSVRFFGQKPVQIGLTLFFPVWLGFFSLGSVWFFWFQAYKTETEPVGFFKILIGFFSRFGFFGYFFYLLGLINFSVFLLIPNLDPRFTITHIHNIQYIFSRFNYLFWLFSQII